MLATQFVNIADGILSEFSVAPRTWPVVFAAPMMFENEGFDSDVMILLGKTRNHVIMGSKS